MSRLPRTLGFGFIQVTAAYFIWMWSTVMHSRFLEEHPQGTGARISHLYWDYSWVGIIVAVLLAGTLVLFHIRKLHALYDSAFYLGMWLLVPWFGGALVALNVSFVGWWSAGFEHF
jgi:hypothetical protein